MRLIDKQRLFLGDFAALVRLAQDDLGYFVKGGETLRGEQQAEWNATHCRVWLAGERCERVRADHGKGWADKHDFRPIGSRNSLHCVGLAGDLLILEDGGTRISNDRRKYEKLGSFWKAIRPANCWGGDFEGFPDLGHFSREHGGRR